MFARFLPQTVPFFEFLVQQNALLQEMSEALAVVMDNTEASERHLKRINLLEEEADRLYRSITQHLSQTFITPIDREDIHAINMAQERVADKIQHLANRFFISGFMYQRFPAQMITERIRGMLRDTKSMLDEISMKKDVSAHIHTLKSRKSDFEMFQSTGLAELMDSEIETFERVREIILWGQVYDRMERTVDAVSDLADTLEEVALKYV